MVQAQEWTYNYETLRKITGLSINSLYQYRRRGDLDPTRLDSVLLFISRHGKPALRRRILSYALEWQLSEKPGRKRG